MNEESASATSSIHSCGPYCRNPICAATREVSLRMHIAELTTLLVQARDSIQLLAAAEELAAVDPLIISINAALKNRT